VSGVYRRQKLYTVRCQEKNLARTQDMRCGKEQLFLSSHWEFTNDIHRSTTVGGYSANLFPLPECLRRHPGVSRNLNARYQGHGTPPPILQGGADPKELMRACSWQSQTTFTEFYLKDVSVVQGDCPAWGLSQWHNKFSVTKFSTFR